MGQRFSTSARTPHPAPEHRTRCFHVRRGEVTPELLHRIAGERETGRLARLTLDCRKSEFDDDLLVAAERAAGLNRLVLEC